ncbi:MAG: dTMP kinase [Candidatus Bathyarchaeia archaeon]
MKKGFFICVEGLDGCGKTTQTKLLVKNLRKIGYDAVYTAEPTRGKIGRFIRRHCLHGEERLSAVVEALLFAADRFEHVKNKVVPALNDGKIVVSDRYVYSSYAYQGAAGLDLKWIEKVNAHAVRPHLAIFVDVEPEIAVKRLKPRKSVMEDLETQRKVREIYLDFVDKGELVRVNGNKPIKVVATDILRVVNEFLGKKQC